MTIKKIVMLSFGVLAGVLLSLRATDDKPRHSAEEKAAFSERCRDAVRRLIKAVKGGNCADVKAILAEPIGLPLHVFVNRHHPDEKKDGKTALMALRSGYTDYSEHVSLSDLEYDSDDLLAPEGDVLKILELLLGAGANVKAKDKNGQTALMHAVRNEENHVVRRLSREKEALNLVNHWGQTALIVAAQEANLTAVQILLKAGANTHPVDQNGRSALDHAKLVCSTARKEAGWVHDREGYYEQSNERRLKREAKKIVELLSRGEIKSKSKAHRGSAGDRGRGARGRAGYRGRGRGHRGGGGGVGRA